jgi:organic hydroperoxide reductase OsmC/OhrA
MSSENAVDPEEALVASISSCHMLSFLSIAASQGYVVESYIDEASGVMRKNDAGKVAITNVSLEPRIRFSAALQPDEESLEEMHHQAHEICFIANSVRTQISCNPIIES